tara:strand:- start:42 stop:323 length:282 start_codon:yes stop_codon:yes gene_type:complete
MLKNLNIASAKRKNSNDIDPITYGLWRLACIFVPDVATIIPANAYVKDILKTYTQESIRDFFCETFPRPAIMPVKIGTIGRTHGVKANNNPAR